MKNHKWFLCLLVVPALFLAGCTAESGSGPSGSGAESRPDSGAGSSAVDTSKPDSMIKEVARGVSSGNAEVVWNTLPASYQTDIQDVTTLLGEKMDADVWNQSFETLGKVTKVLREKKSFILGNMMVKSMMASSPVAEADIDKSWNGTVGFLDTIIHSEISTLEGLRKVQVAEFVKKTGGKLLKQGVDLAKMSPDGVKGLAMLQDPQVKIVSEDGDTATIEVTADGETESESLKVVKVEGKWIPDEMAREWKSGLEEAKGSIAEMDFSGQVKQQYAMMMPMVNGVLDQLLAAESQGDFDTAIMGIMQMFGGMGGPGGPAGEGGGFPGGGR